ncbi:MULTISPECIES: LysR family transcriptional regulator [unclassified Paenibacillus]|uniref:LysR family transcriptional regulator n=1 Tax=unclassified Paenibacillus TaxID=185978 RepID=UPI00070DF10F|nr:MULTISPECIES: LysR family transcriptional regulator [unclassified Paenibacillus]KQX64694.1 LysR family transcriptional regulator [Paenibacillus sp. Root444D2]KRE51947.1 LysR family transcriptional regulator [Paenibacillus sp. Soil724D2]
MDLTYFRTFREVARRKSFTRAAEELGYAQSSITMQIQKLEREYGVPLFERYGRQLRLTAPGESLLKLVLQMLDLYDQSKEMITSEVSGTLTIGTINSLAAYYLPPYLHVLKQQFPGLNIQLFPDSEASLITKVRDGDYDIGLLLDRYPADTTLACTKVREEPLVLVAPLEHPLTKRTQIQLTDFQQAEFIVTEEGCIYRGMFEKLLKDHAVPLQIGFELGNLETIKHCVMNGLGIALLPQIAVQNELEQGKLAHLPFSHSDLKLDLQLLLHPKKWMSQPLQTFIRQLTEG